MNNLIRKKINLSLRSLLFLFPITIFIYLFFSDLGNFGNLIFLTKKLSYEISFGLFLISIDYLLRYYRWRIIINSFGFYPSAKAESKLWFASYAFTATPGKIGELVRCFFLRKVFNVPLNYSFIAIIFERLFDLIAVLIYLFCFLLNNEKTLILPLEKLLRIGIIIFFPSLFLLKFYDLRNYINNIKFKFLNKTFKFIDLGRLNNLNNFLKINILLKITLISVISWGLEGTSLLLLLHKLSFDISFLASTFIHTTSGLIGALTMLPGGLGATEAISVYILKFQSIPIDYGIPITSIMRLMTLWYISFLGILSLFFIRKEVFKDAQKKMKIISILPKSIIAKL